MDIVSKLRYMARQYTNGELSRGGNTTRHYLDEAADEIESLRARVQELEADKRKLIECNDQVSIELATAHEKIAELEAGMGEPVATICMPDPDDERDGVRFNLKDWEKLNALPAGTKLYTTPQPTPTVQSAVAAAIRKAAEVCEGHENMLDQHKQWVKKNILAIPHDDSALREICNTIVEETLDTIGWASQVKNGEIINRVLGEKK